MGRVPRPGRVLAATLALLATVIPAGCSGDGELSGPLRIAAGSTGGIYYSYAHALARVADREMPDTRPRVLVTSASIENLRLVADGRAEVGFTLADSAAEAVAGRGRFARRQPVRALARLYDNYLHLVVRADAPIRRLADLRGRVVSLGEVGSGTELTATRLLDSAGIAAHVRPVRLELLDAAQALRDGEIEAFFWSGGLPTGPVAALAREPGVALVPLADHAPRMRRHYGDFYAEATVPASAYGLGAALPTIAVPNYLVVHASMPDEHAYALTRMLFDHQSDLARAHASGRLLNLRSAIATYPLRLHPGARRYYRETNR